MKKNIFIILLFLLAVYGFYIANTEKNTWVNYRLPKSDETWNNKMSIKTYQDTGNNSIDQNVKNDTGKVVGRGIYFIHIKQKNWPVIKKYSF